MEVLYRAHATASGGGRDEGRSATDDGKIDVKLSTPKEMGGKGGDGTNPEQLFATGYAACFDNALPVAAKQLQLQPAGTATSVEVGIGQTAEGGYALDIDLHVEVKGLEHADAQRLVEAAHKICPYSNATRGNVDVRLHVTAV